MSFDRYFSRIFGLIGGLKFSRPIQNFINARYAKFFNLDMREFGQTSDYESLNALFTRELKIPREISSDKGAFISPCDGTCLSFGVSKDKMAFSIKGMEYSLPELLNEAISDDELAREWDFVNIYLSPRDYHHYHAPCDLNILSATYIPGRLYSVAKPYLARIAGLYAKNERVVLRCKSDSGVLMWLVFVGALNVGRMKFSFDERIQTNARADFIQIYGYENLWVKKGERLGNFELGSTILIISEKDAIRYNLSDEKTLKFAEVIGTIDKKGE